MKKDDFGNIPVYVVLAFLLLFVVAVATGAPPEKFTTPATPPPAQHVLIESGGSAYILCAGDGSGPGQFDIRVNGPDSIRLVCLPGGSP